MPVTCGYSRTLIITFALVEGVILPPPLWFFEDNSKTKRSSVTKLGIPFH